MGTARVLDNAFDEAQLVASLDLLARVDELPAGATGALCFGGHGIVLVESRRICWAATRNMRRRLTDILCAGGDRAVPRDAVEYVVRACRSSGRPFGESLVAAGLITDTGLRTALRQHVTEALIDLATRDARFDAFLPHTRRGYDPRYTFSSSEVWAALAGANDPLRSGAAARELTGILVPESTGAAFMRVPNGARTALIAVEPACEVPVRELVEACTWVTSLLDVAAAFDPSVQTVRVARCARTSLVAWRKYEVDFAALCWSAAAAARVVSELRRRGQQLTPPPESLARRIRSP